MADANIKINIETQSLDQLNAKLVTLQNEIKKVPVGSAEFKKLSAEIRRLDGAASDAGKKLKAIDVGQLAGNVAKVGASVASASALFKQFGDQGSDSNKQIQQALEATNTILGAAAIAEGIAAAGEVAFAVATEGATIAQGLFAAAVGTSTGALKALKVALVTTGIGALVVGLGLLIGYLIDSAEETDNLAKEQDKLNKAFEKQIENIDDAIRRRQNQAKIDEAQAKKEKKSLEEINEIRRKQLVFERDKNAEKVGLANKNQERELANFKGTEEEKQKIIDKYNKQRSQAIVAQNNAETELELNRIALSEEVAKRDADILKQRIDAENSYYRARADLLNVTYKERLDTINKNEKEEIRIARQSGLSATEIQFKIQEINLRASNERVKIVQEEEDKKLKIVQKSVTDRLEIEKQAAEVAGDVEKVKEIQTAINKIKEDTAKAITDAQAEAVARLDELLKTGKIVQEVYTKAIADLKTVTDDFKTGVDKTVTDSGSTIITSAVNSVLNRFDSALNATITELGIAADESEKAYLKSIQGKAKDKVQKEEDAFAQNQIKNRKAVAQATIDSINLEIKALEELTGLSSEEEENRTKKILDLRAKRSKAELEIAKATTEQLVDTTDEETAKKVAAVEKYFKALKEFYAAFETSLQSLGNILADQATLRDLQLEEEIERVGEVFDARFKLIDEEEKKLDDAAAAKDKNLTKEEKKRRQLAKERADLEAQQVEELAQLENDRANAAADAAIKQANLNFALAVGQITISTAEAIAKTIAQLGGVGAITPPGIALIAFTAAAGAAQIAAASSARSTAISQAEASRPGVSGGKNVGRRVSKAEGGLITGPGNGISDSVPANLSNGEFVVNANATQRYLPLLTQLNQSGLQGGNPVNPSGGNNDMVALLQRIDEKLSQPNRAYVVATDIENIQNKQNYINRRSNVL